MRPLNYSRALYYGKPDSGLSCARLVGLACSFFSPFPASVPSLIHLAQKPRGCGCSLVPTPPPLWPQTASPQAHQRLLQAADLMQAHEGPKISPRPEQLAAQAAEGGNAGASWLSSGLALLASCLAASFAWRVVPTSAPSEMLLVLQGATQMSPPLGQNQTPPSHLTYFYPPHGPLHYWWEVVSVSSHPCLPITPPSSVCSSSLLLGPKHDRGSVLFFKKEREKKRKRQ